MTISQEKLLELELRMKRLGIKEEDLIEKFILGTGSGGQKVNKTSSSVYLKHLPTGVEVKCTKNRSQNLNRFFARRELCDRLESKLFGVTTKQEKRQAKIKKQKSRRARRRKVNESESLQID